MLKNSTPNMARFLRIGGILKNSTPKMPKFMNSSWKRCCPPKLGYNGLSASTSHSRRHGFQTPSLGGGFTHHCYLKQWEDKIFSKAQVSRALWHNAFKPTEVFVCIFVCRDGVKIALYIRWWWLWWWGGEENFNCCFTPSLQTKNRHR